MKFFILSAIVIFLIYCLTKELITTGGGSREDQWKKKFEEFKKFYTEKERLPKRNGRGLENKNTFENALRLWYERQLKQLQKEKEINYNDKEKYLLSTKEKFSDQNKESKKEKKNILILKRNQLRNKSDYFNFERYWIPNAKKLKKILELSGKFPSDDTDLYSWYVQEKEYYRQNPDLNKNKQKFIEYFRWIENAITLLNEFITKGTFSELRTWYLAEKEKKKKFSNRQLQYIDSIGTLLSFRNKYNEINNTCQKKFLQLNKEWKGDKFNEISNKIFIFVLKYKRLPNEKDQEFESYFKKDSKLFKKYIKIFKLCYNKYASLLNNKNL